MAVQHSDQTSLMYWAQFFLPLKQKEIPIYRNLTAWCDDLDKFWSELMSVFVHSKDESSQINLSSVEKRLRLLLLGVSRYRREEFSYPIALGSGVPAFTIWDWPWELHSLSKSQTHLDSSRSVHTKVKCKCIFLVGFGQWGHQLNKITIFRDWTAFTKPWCYSAILRPRFWFNVLFGCARNLRRQ